MKVVAVIAILIIVLVLGCCLSVSKKINTPTSNAVDDLLLAGMLTVFADGAILIFNNELVSTLAYSTYLFCTDLLIYFLMRFIYLYINENRPAYVSDKVMVPILVVDAIILFSNYFHGLSFGVYKSTIFEDVEFYRFSLEPLYIFHAVVIYGMVIICLVALSRKIITAYGIYRLKYHIVLIIIVIGIIVNTISLYFELGIDISVIIYVLASILFHYFALKYIPRQLRQFTIGLVVDNMEYGMLVFDVDMHCGYSNELGTKYFGIKEGDILDEDSEFFKIIGVPKSKLRDEYSDNHNRDAEWDRIRMIPDETGKLRRISFQYKRLYNKVDLQIGSYIFARDTTEEYEAILQEKYKSTHDELTGLYNKEYFYERCREVLDANPEEDYFMISSNVLNFKLVNDLFGHEKGDQLLCRIADKMREICHDYNIYGRIANDKFALMMPKSKFKRDDFISAPKSVAYVDEDINYPLAIYVGVYDITDRDMPIAVMYDRASMAMDSIKGDYSQRVAHYDDTMRVIAMNEQNMLSRFEIALRKGDIRMFLQPQVNDKGEVIGAEALARWVDPIDGIIPPVEFIPLLEKNGMIGKLDVYIWKLACNKLAQWKKMGVNMSISVNISPKDFYFMDLDKIFRNYIKMFDIELSKLHLEITETAMMTNIKKQVKLINKLKSIGYIVEMDDFGSGYSSLNMLKDIPVDVVKIDMAFLQKSDNPIRSKIILSSVINLCKDLGLQIIVEGVEDTDQLEFLLSAGCDVFQGFFYSKPIPVDEFEEQYIADYDERKRTIFGEDFNEDEIEGVTKDQEPVIEEIITDNSGDEFFRTFVDPGEPEPELEQAEAEEMTDNTDIEEAGDASLDNKDTQLRDTINSPKVSV